MIPSQLPSHDPTAVMGRRIGAFVVDGLLIAVPVVLLASMDVVFYGAEMLEDAGLTPGEACEIHRNRFNEPCVALFGRAWYVNTPVSPVPLLTGLGLSLLLLVVLQGLAGLTPGKALFGLRTVRRDGRPPGVGRALARSLLWIVDGAPWFFPLVGLITGLSSPGHRRVGDMAADTLVVGKGDAGRPVTVPGLADGEDLRAGSHDAPGGPHARPGEPAYAFQPPATRGAAMPSSLPAGTLPLSGEPPALPPRRPAGGAPALPARTPALPGDRLTDSPPALPAGRSTDSLPALPAGRSTEGSPTHTTGAVPPAPVSRSRPVVDVPPGPGARSAGDSGVDEPGAGRTPADDVGDEERPGGDRSEAHPVAPGGDDRGVTAATIIDTADDATAPIEPYAHTDAVAATGTHPDTVAATGIRAPDGGAVGPADDPAGDDPPDRLVHHIDPGSVPATDPEDHGRAEVAPPVEEGPDPTAAIPVEGQASGPTTAGPGPDATAVMSTAPPEPDATTVISAAAPGPDDTAVMPGGQWGAPAVPPGTSGETGAGVADAPPADAEAAEPGEGPVAAGPAEGTRAAGSREAGSREAGSREATHPYPPQWDPARGTYIVWEPVRGQWLGWDNTAKEWHPL